MNRNSIQTLVPWTEHEHQRAFIQWCAAMTHFYPELILVHATPNAGKRGIKTAAMMKAEGLRSGFPDVGIPVSRAGYHGLYIEFKKYGNYPTPEQRFYLKMLTLQGNLCAVAYEHEAAENFVQSYLNGSIVQQPTLAFYILAVEVNQSKGIAVTETMAQLVDSLTVRLEEKRQMARKKFPRQRRR